jgi:hypothetical protein
MRDPLSDPRVHADTYMVRPACYDQLPEYERHSFCLWVVNGHSWGWSVRDNPQSSRAMNRKGELIYESRGSGHNKARRWELEEALEIALKHVDKMKRNMRTAQEWVDFWAKDKETNE